MRMYSTLKLNVDTVRKSIAQELSKWLRRNVNHVENFGPELFWLIHVFHNRSFARNIFVIQQH